MTPEPTTDLGQIGPHTRLPAPQLNRVGSGWTLGTAVERLDNVLNLPLGEAVALAPIEPRPAPPDEAVLRGQLREALAVLREADEGLQQAQAAHTRALEQQARGQAQLAEYDSLDGEITAVLAEQLRRGAADSDVAEGLSERAAARAGAQALARAGAAAVEVLAQELAAAAETASKAEQATATATAALLSLAASRLAGEHAALLRQAKAITDVLHGFDRFLTPMGLSEPPEVLTILRADGRFGQHDSAAWRALGRRLREDPDGAELTITVGEIECQRF